MAKKKEKLKKFRKLKIIFVCCSAALILFVLNFGYQLIRKPSEILSLLPLQRAKTLHTHWLTYKNSFKKYSVDYLTPTYLGALSYVESAGNPFATPKWKFKFEPEWQNLYSPESTSVGLFQLTDGTYQRAKKLCVRGQKVIDDGRWDDFNSCWFNWTYLRTSSSDSIEMTAAYLYRDTEAALKLTKLTPNSEQKRELASVIHLCGKSKGEQLVQLKFQLHKLTDCGRFDPMTYTRKVQTYEREIIDLNPAFSGRSIIANEFE